MTEEEQIQNNIKGEKPLKDYQIVQIRNINNAKEVLANFKNAVLTILKNKNLNDEDPKWKKILPQGIVNKLEQLNSDDKKYDELIFSINSNIDDYQRLKLWEWYSSFEVEKGFDIIVKGNFNAGKFINFIHCQNVPLTNIKIIDANKKEEYELKTIKDYTTYKTLN